MKIEEKKELPLVSVIVPCYNHERFITTCIESIYSQTYKNIELTVIDDGSTDNSPQILKELQAKYGFNLIFQENHGIAYTLNKGYKEYSNGKYISGCSSDDFWAVDKLEKQVQFLESNQFYPMCYGKTYYVDENSNILHNLDSANNNLKGGWIFDDIFLFKLQPPVNYMFRTSIFSEVGYYDEDIFAEDYYMNLKISSKYTIGFLNEYLGYYRLTAIPTKVDKTEIVSNSHLMAIELYKNHYLYKKVKTMVNLRNFCAFSGHTKHKIKAINFFFKSISLFYHKLFIIGCIMLIVRWKR